MSKKVVLAFSGGLDTSFCVPYLKEQGYEVHTVMVNTGGFSAEEEKAIEERAMKLGAASHKNVNAVNTYYEKGIRYLIYGNILKNATYPLSVSSERVFQALEVLKQVKAIGADAVAHKVDVRSIFLQIVIDRRLDKFQSCSGSQIRTADPDHQEHIALALDLFCSLLDACIFFLVIVHRKVHPADEIIPGNAPFVQIICTYLRLCILHLDFRVSNEPIQAIFF